MLVGVRSWRLSIFMGIDDVPGWGDVRLYWSLQAPRALSSALSSASGSATSYMPMALCPRREKAMPVLLLSSGENTSCPKVTETCRPSRLRSTLVAQFLIEVSVREFEIEMRIRSGVTPYAVSMAMTKYSRVANKKYPLVANKRAPLVAK